MHPLAYVAIVLAALIVVLLATAKLGALLKMDRWSVLLVELVATLVAAILVVHRLGGLHL